MGWVFILAVLDSSVLPTLGAVDALTPSLAPEAYEGMRVDYIVRGEGEVTFSRTSARTREGRRLRK